MLQTQLKVVYGSLVIKWGVVSNLDDTVRSIMKDIRNFYCINDLLIFYFIVDCNMDTSGIFLSIKKNIILKKMVKLRKILMLTNNKTSLM